ncbi:MAG: 2-oxoacid:acceptor oxidoreductase family protein [Planctomycetaceae bacterium]|nr:2-oxoacid:acceptor oxidoreductase family protein [Planctomycetaceae bacterium]
MKKQKQYNVTFGGIGGQGIIKASELLGWAALYEGFQVKKSEMHGMSQRGGSVESHVRFGKRVYSPLIGPGEADFLLCFHADEHARLKGFLRPGGVDLLDYLKQVEAMVENPKTVNTALVGVLSVLVPISEASWMRAIETVFPEKIREINKAVFAKARALVKE